PLSMPDGFGDWVLSVFLFEAVWAAVIFLYIRFRGHYPSSVDGMLALTLLFAGQVFFESIRAEALRIGFIRVEQVLSAIGLFAILMYCQHVHESHTLNMERVIAFFVITLLLIGAEFALDRTDWPDVFIRLGMMGLSALLASVVLHAVFVREDQFKTYAGYCPVPEGAA
ncbi:MAG TPA: hypothetical protein VLA21_00685, partial [Candidatus Limnocylindria bacterium]|nr:hypothetical protein [Candidatus Limnocylindria bacterium]